MDIFHAVIYTKKLFAGNTEPTVVHNIKDMLVDVFLAFWLFYSFFLFPFFLFELM